MELGRFQRALSVTERHLRGVGHRYRRGDHTEADPQDDQLTLGGWRAGGRVGREYNAHRLGRGLLEDLQREAITRQRGLRVRNLLADDGRHGRDRRSLGHEKIREAADGEQDDHHRGDDARAVVATSANVGSWSGHDRDGLRAFTRSDGGDRTSGVGAPEGDVVSRGAHRLSFGEAQQVSAELIRGLVTLRGALRERLHHDRLKVVGNRVVEISERRDRSVHVLARHRDRRVADERRTTDEHLVQYDAERVHVTTTVDGGALGLLGREIGGRAHDRALFSKLVLTRDGLRDAEVGDFHLTVRGDEDVAGLHVTVHDTVAVRVAKRRRHLGDQLGRARRRQRARAAQHVRERRALDELHDDEVRALILTPVKDRDDVGVRKICGGLCFTAESLHEERVGTQFGVEDLECDGPIQQEVLGPVDHRHPAAGNEMGYLVPI